MCLTDTVNFRSGLTTLFECVVDLKCNHAMILMTTLIFFQERLSHGISASGFPGNHRTSDFQPPYFPPPFPSQQPTPQEVFAAQNAHLADPYNVTNSLSFQQQQVRKTFIK